MGLLSKLALLPLAPVAGVVWLAEQIERQAAGELDELGSVRRQLEELVALRERGEISDEELAEAEDELLGSLDLAPPEGETSERG